MMSGGGVLWGGGVDRGGGVEAGGGVDAGGGVGEDDGGFDLSVLGVGVGVVRLVTLTRACRGSAGASPRTASRGAEAAAGTAGSSARVTFSGLAFGFCFSPALATA
jgi:hypothetical protein